MSFKKGDIIMKNIIFDIKWFFTKVYMKYITKEIQGEDIFPLYGEQIEAESNLKNIDDVKALLERI